MLFAQSPQVSQGTARAIDHSASGSNEHPTDANELLAQAAVTLAREPSFQADFRNRIKLLNREMVGKGTYRQVVDEGRRKYRLDITLRVGDESSSLRQACNARFLWTQRNFPGQRNFTRLDLLEVRKAGLMERAGGPPSPLMALGGMPAMLEGLAQRFQFEAPEETVVSDQKAWVLKGSWRVEQLRRLLPEVGESGPIEVKRIPDQMPTNVVVVLSRSQAWPLFPQLVEYRRAAESLNDQAEQAEPMVTMEFVNVVKGVRFQGREFEFPAGDEDEHDITSDFIARYARKP